MRSVRMVVCGLLVALLALTGCGSGERESSDGSGQSEAASKDASPAPEADADGLVEVTQQGLTLKVPATWKLDKDTMDDTLFIWVNPKCKSCGLVALSIENSTQTAEDYVRFTTGPRGTLHQMKTTKTRVPVEGLGQGYRLHAVYQQNITDHLVVATIDGLLVHVTSVPDEEHPEYTDLVLASLKRQL